MANSQITLYDADNGNSTLVDAGDGGGASRMKSWENEVSRWLRESVELVALKGLAKGRVANYPSFDNGEGISGFAGVQLYKVQKNTAILATGDGTVVDFGNEALTQTDRTHVDYSRVEGDPDIPPVPRGATNVPFLQTIGDAAGDFSLTGTSDLTIEVNGEQYTFTGLIDETSTELVARMQAFNFPLHIVDADTATKVRIFANGRTGLTQNIKAVASAAAAVLFTGAGESSQEDVLYQGTGGPLGVMDNLSNVGGFKPQLRILPGSLVVTATVAAAADVASDDKAGGFTGGSLVAASTIDYDTGVIDLDYTGNPPDNATSVTVTWKSLVPLILSEPARIPVGGMELAIDLK